MFWIALALTANAADAAPPVGLLQSWQATATVRIVHAATVRFGEVATDRQASSIRATPSLLRDADGRERPARIVEFP